MPDDENSRPWQGGHVSSTAINDMAILPTRRRRVLEAELNGYGSLVRGHGSRELVMLVSRGNRAPVWSTIRRGWSVQESTARDVIAAAEARNYEIVIAGPRSVGMPVAVGDVVADPSGGLW